MADQILPEGIRFFDKNEKQPSFVKGSIVITMSDLLAFVNANPQLITDYQGKNQIRLQLLESKKGTNYLAVDTFKPIAKNNSSKDDLPF